MADDFDDIDNIRDELENTQAKLYELQEERDRQLAELEFKISRVKETADEEWQGRMKAVEEMYESKLKSVVTELDAIRAAFNGDSNGWVAIETPGGLIKYENKKTGEKTLNEPEVFKIANLFRQVDAAEATRIELEELEDKYKQLQLKQKESDIIINKDKTELSYLRNTERKWRDSARKISSSLSVTAQSFNAQCDEVLSGLGRISSSGRRIHEQIPYFEVMKKFIAGLQSKIEDQQSSIINLHGEVRRLVNEAIEKDKRIETLTINVNQEVERLCKPMRDKVAETIVSLMKEKATRAQERRELGDLWPKGHLMPTLLMKYRSLSDDEMKRRIEDAKEANANLAISLEIRSKVAESKMWELKYDDYGRPFYEHTRTGETQWDEPEIRRYQPPIGRDEMGNLIDMNADANKRWKTLANDKGEIYYRNIDNGEITFKSPYTYKHDEYVKSNEQIVSEAAQIVLKYIKHKILKHIEIMKDIKHSNENLLTPDERKQKAKEEKNKARLGLQSVSQSLNESTLDSAVDINNVNNEIQENDEDTEELKLYQYDIETVEMIAWKYDNDISLKDKKDNNGDKIRSEYRKYLNQSNIRLYDIENGYIGPTVYETDTKLLNISQLRFIVESIAKSEDKLEYKLSKTRDNLKDFSYLLLERINDLNQKESDAINDEFNNLQIQNFVVENNNSIETSQSLISNLNTEEITASPVTLEGNLQSLDNDVKNTSITSFDNLNDNESTISSEHDDIETNLNDTSLIISDPMMLTNYRNIDNNIEISTVNLSTTTIDLLDQRNKIAGPSISPEIIKMCTNLLNFTLFCGYINAPMDDLPESINQIIPQDLRSFEYEEDYLTNPITTDDKWLTASYYLCLTKERVDMVRQMTTRTYDSVYGNISVTPLHSENFVSNTIYEDEPVISRPTVEDLPISSSLNQSSLNIDTSLRNSMSMNSISNGDPFSLNQENFNEFTNVMGKKSASALADLVDRKNNQPWIPKVTALDNNIEFKHLLWKSRQLMGEVLRYQLQQESVKIFINEKSNQSNSKNSKHKMKKRNVIKGNMPAISDSNNALLETDFDEMVTISFSKLEVDNLKHNFWIENQSVYIQLSICGWVDRTSIKPFSNKAVIWNSNELSNLSVQLSYHKIITEEVVFEIYNRMIVSADKCIGTCRINLKRLLGIDSSNENIFQLPIYNNINQKTGDLLFKIDVEFPNTSSIKSKNEIDDIGNNHNIEILNDTSDLLTQDYLNVDYNQTKTQSKEKDILANHFPYLADEKISFSKLIDDIRSEDGKLLKLLSGDIIADDILQKGYRINEKIVKKLPTFKTARRYLKQKANMHNSDISEMDNEIKVLYTDINKVLKQKIDSSTVVYNESKSKYKSLNDRLDHVNEEVQRVIQRVNEMKQENVKPKEPTLLEISPVVKIPDIPNMANSREGKTRRILPKQYFDDIVQQIKAGEMDGRDWFHIFTNYRATPKQINRLNHAISERNHVLLENRKIEENEREKLIENYNLEVLFYEKEEKKRKKELEKFKKDLRKVYLKYDCCKERLDLHYNSYQSIELDNQTINQMNILHNQSCEKFKILKLKINIEKNRQLNLIKSLYIKLLNCINNRRKCYDIPKNINNNDELSIYIEKSNNYLSSLRFDIYDIKQCIYNEGTRLRTTYMEELNLSKYELNRNKNFYNIILQRISIDKIIERNQYEIVNLYESKEKILLVDAEKDDKGIDTIDDEGERYDKSKKWESSEYKAIEKLIELVYNKITLMNNVSYTASQCQRNILESMGAKWEYDLLSVRDNWIDNSDYERAQFLSNELVKDLNNKLNVLQFYELSIYNNHNELFLTNQAYKDQIVSNQSNHANETMNLTTTSNNVISIIQNELLENKERYLNKQKQLEDSITEMSRELQTIREQLSTQAIINEDKQKILFALIATQQATLQNITIKMDILINERDKFIIQSRLNFDRIRLQLRQERRYSSNLLFIIHSQRGIFMYYQRLLDNVIKYSKEKDKIYKLDKMKLKKEIYENIYTIVNICNNPNMLFDFFITRLANLCGSNTQNNNSLAENNAIMVLSALSKSPRAVIRKYSARALGSIGWDGNIDKRIINWDIISYFKLVKHQIIHSNKELFESNLDNFIKTGNFNNMIEYNEQLVSYIHNNTNEFNSNDFNPNNKNNLSIRQMIKQRRQYALRNTRYYEKPNSSNQRLINMKDGIIPALIDLCNDNINNDWEIIRNAVLAICIASYEPKNHYDICNDNNCIVLLIKMCNHKDDEIRTHAAITIANLCHNDEYAQLKFGELNAITVLLSMCSSTVVDVLEACTSALANLTCYCDNNCYIVIQNNGINTLITLINTVYTENLLDIDQNDEIQSNAAEILANISRYNTELTTSYFDKSIITSLIFMLASTNIQVKRHTPLVIGNISQSESCREQIGLCGGIEALFLSIETNDPSTQTNCLWALCNLMWHSPNQERAGRYMNEIIQLMTNSYGTVKTYSFILLGNVLYYNSINRVRYLEFKNSLDILINIIIHSCYYNDITMSERTVDNSSDNVISYDSNKGYIIKNIDLITIQTVEQLVLEHSLRSLLSLSYVDYVALWLGTTMLTNIHFINNNDNISKSISYESRSYLTMFIQLITPPHISKDVIHYTLGIICNLCVHHINRKLILDYNGIQSIVSLYHYNDDNIMNLSINIIKYLEDVTPIEILLKMKKDIGIDNMINILKNPSTSESKVNDSTANNNDLTISGSDTKNLLGMTDSLVKAVVAECIGEEIFNNPDKQQHIYNLGGIEILLSIISDDNEPIESLLPSLWSLRNLLHNFTNGQHRFYMNDGIDKVTSILSKCITGVFNNQVEKVIEACLSCLTAAILNHNNNSRRLLVVGLESIISLADEILLKGNNNIDVHLRNAASSESIIALSKAILLMLGPYNYIICKNCSKRQELNGTSCSFCGHRLRVEVVEKNTLSTSKQNRNIVSSPIKLSNSLSNNVLINKQNRQNKKPSTAKTLRSKTAN